MEQKVWEIPQTLFSVAGKKFGFSGGFYLRALPSWFIIHLMKRKNEANKNVFLYLHPREVDPKAPRLELPLIERFIHYYGVAGCESKFAKILDHFDGTFIPMGDYIRKLSLESA